MELLEEKKEIKVNEINLAHKRRKGEVNSNTLFVHSKWHILARKMNI